MCHRDGRIGPGWLPPRRTRIDPATVERYRVEDRQDWMDPPCTKAYATIKGVPLAVLTQDRQRGTQSAHPGVEEQPLKRLLRTLTPSGAWLAPRAARRQRSGGAAARSTAHADLSRQGGGGAGVDRSEDRQGVDRSAPPRPRLAAPHVSPPIRHRCLV